MESERRQPIMATNTCKMCLSPVQSSSNCQGMTVRLNVAFLSIPGLPLPTPSLADKAVLLLYVSPPEAALSLEPDRRDYSRR